MQEKLCREAISLVETFLSLSPPLFLFVCPSSLLPSPLHPSCEWQLSWSPPLLPQAQSLEPWSCSLPQQSDFKYRCPGFSSCHFPFLFSRRQGCFIPASPPLVAEIKTPPIQMGHPVNQFTFALCRNIARLLLTLFSNTVVFSILETLRKIFC